MKGEPEGKGKTMARHVGIVACSAEGAALCYRTFCTEAADRMGRHGHTDVYNAEVGTV